MTVNQYNTSKDNNQQFTSPDLLVGLTDEEGTRC